MISDVGDDMPNRVNASINKYQLEVLTIWHALFDPLRISNSRGSSNYTVSLILQMIGKTMIMWILPCKFHDSHYEFMKMV